MRTTLLMISVCLGCLASSPALAEVHYQVSDGKLVGASGVIVGTDIYNVTFADGSCNGLYNGCAQASFTFQNEQSATTAAQALLDQVLLDSDYGHFDSNPGLVFGCGSPYYVVSCRSVIPYYTVFGSYDARAANNHPYLYVDVLDSTGGWADSDLSEQNMWNFAKFLKTGSTIAGPINPPPIGPPPVGGIPEPASWTMLIAGFGLTGASLRRKRVVQMA